MNAFPQYQSYDAVGLAELVRSGEVHPGELVEAAAQFYQPEDAHIDVEHFRQASLQAVVGDDGPGPRALR